MTPFKYASVTLMLCLFALATAGAKNPAPSPGGEVQLPLDVYTELLARANDPKRPPRSAPAGHALGRASVDVTVENAGARTGASVVVDLSIDVLEDDWVLVPVLPSGTPVESVTVDGNAVQLIAAPDGLAWSVRKAGTYAMRLTYKVDAGVSEGGRSLAVPLPGAAAINLTASLPGRDLDATVIPAAGVRSTADGDRTRLTATVPRAEGVQISWRAPSGVGFTVSRATYRGELQDEAVVWEARFSVELFDGEAARLPLLPRSVTLNDVTIDGKASTILVEGDRFATLVRGQGLHEVAVRFQTPVLRGGGPPRSDFRIPQIPVSRFELILPGKKELEVTPPSNVIREIDGDRTSCVVHVPMTDHVSFAWSEAVPDEIRTEVRANAATYHAAHAEEGVLYVKATVVYEITRGESNVIEMLLPAEVQMNRIESASGAVADWRLAEPDDDGRRVVSVFLDRQLRGPLQLDVYYDRSLPAAGATDGDPVELPLIRLAGAQRQRGMVALLAGAELTLDPVELEQATKVGENQLPAFVRDALQMTVAHTYKYAESLPRLSVRPAVPERAQGKFDAQVDTLISLGDVTLTGASSVQISVKSGRLADLAIRLPRGIGLLNLTAPSLRTYRVRNESDDQVVDIEFTQDMDGQFWVDLGYERILVDGEPRVPVATPAVDGAEVQQGRVAVEALTAVEVQPAVARNLSPLDINELPQQLILKTTNPILLAYKYVHGETAHQLDLEVTRHEVLGVQQAAIDSAAYTTLFTPDGLLVTTAEFTLRNSRKQFLRIRLPAESEVWSVFVDGRAEKPAMAEADDGSRDVLIKIIHSTRAFPVQLIYATSGARIRGLGSIHAALPVPDILVTDSRWDVFLPEDMSYGRARSNMNTVGSASPASGDEAREALGRLEKAAAAQQAIRPLRITVPRTGVHYAFEKLYANQSDGDAWFELAYASPAGALVGQAAALTGAGAFWAGTALLLFGAARRKSVGVALVTAGLVLATLAVGAYQVSPTPSLVVSLAALLLLAARLAVRFRSETALDPADGI